MGAGRTELMRAIFGLDPLDSGDIFIEGKKATLKKPSDAVQKGIGFITENRKDEGLVLDTSIRKISPFRISPAFHRKDGLTKKRAGICRPSDQAADDQNGIAGNPRAKPFRREPAKSGHRQMDRNRS